LSCSYWTFSNHNYCITSNRVFGVPHYQSVIGLLIIFIDEFVVCLYPFNDTNNIKNPFTMLPKLPYSFFVLLLVFVITNCNRFQAILFILINFTKQEVICVLQPFICISAVYVFEAFLPKLKDERSDKHLMQGAMINLVINWASN
jgi:hypothetical protein